MGSPNFSTDQHLSIDYAVEDNSIVDDVYIENLSAELDKVNDDLSFGKLGIVSGYANGVQLCSKLLIGGNYQNNGSIEDSLNQIAEDFAYEIRNAAMYIEDHLDLDKEIDMKLFIQKTVEAAVSKTKHEDLIIIEDCGAVADFVLERNSSLDYNLDDEDERLDLITHVLDYGYFHNLAEIGLENLIEELDQAARKIAIKYNMSQLSTDKAGWSYTLTPIDDK